MAHAPQSTGTAGPSWPGVMNARSRSGPAICGLDEIKTENAPSSHLNRAIQFLLLLLHSCRLVRLSVNLKKVLELWVRVKGEEVGADGNDAFPFPIEVTVAVVSAEKPKFPSHQPPLQLYWG